MDRIAVLAVGDRDLAWHAEVEWAAAYLDGEIDVAEYVRRISGTV